MISIKAQFWSFDVIFAVVIFSFAVTILALTWFNISNQLSVSYGNGAGIMQLQLQSLTQNLFSPGTPVNWQSSINATNVNTWSGITVGLESSQGSTTLSSNKVYTLLSMANYNYPATKQALGIGYDYYIRITSNSNVGSGINLTIGKNPSNNGALTVYINRGSAVMNGVPVNLQVIVWTNTTLGIS